MDPAQAAQAAAEDAAATGGFDDDNEDTPVLEAPVPPVAASSPEEDDDEVEAPEGARNPDAVQNLIKAERKRAREANARARELEAQLKAATEAAQPAPAASTSSDAELRALRLEVALDKGLSKTLALRLQGATAEELSADADALLAELGTRPAGPGMDGGYRQDPPAPALPPEKAHNAFVVGLLGNARAGRE